LQWVFITIKEEEGGKDGTLETIWLSIIVVVGLVGSLIGIIIPGLPGIPVLWILVALDYWLFGFLGLSGTTMFWLTVLAGVTLVIDYLATALGVKKRGGSLPGLIGSVLGLFVGVMVFNIPGMLIGCFLGAMLGEMIKGHELEKASYIAVGALFGYATATALKLAAWLVYAVVIMTNIF
jgi:uncharacterized protein YqgC (DUF456 family)